VLSSKSWDVYLHGFSVRKIADRSSSFCAEVFKKCQCGGLLLKETETNQATDFDEQAGMMLFYLLRSTWRKDLQAGVSLEYIGRSFGARWPRPFRLPRLTPALRPGWSQQIDFATVDTQSTDPMRATLVTCTTAVSPYKYRSGLGIQIKFPSNETIEQLEVKLTVKNKVEIKGTNALMALRFRVPM
jgi:hypothetical protein